jgi:magnesium chelatase family protein
MTLQSLTNLDGILCPIEVEISLLPGLPEIQIVGLPDAGIKESKIKIKSALKRQGFELPKARTIVVNLRPSHIKKSSQGLELAIALGILLQTNQIRIPKEMKNRNIYVYGEVSLKGEVFCPKEVRGIEVEENDLLITGENSFPLGVEQFQIKSLREFQAGSFIEKAEIELHMQRPELPQTKFSQKQSRLMSIVAAGEHPLLLAGPAGSGKSTFVNAINFLLRPPSMGQVREIHKVWKDKMPTWRPLVSPHHKTPALAMIGGGVPPRFGDITRANGGTLIMDEFTEYHRDVFEGLREPIENRRITISRAGFEKHFPANFLLLATTNLCKCGNYVPKRDNECRCSNRQKEHYFAKLNGPMIDRLSIVTFTDEWGSDGVVGVEEILANVNKAIEFAQKRNQVVPNHYMEFPDLALSKLVNCEPSSRRRLKYFSQVLRTIADLDGCEKPKPKHYGEAEELCLKSHQLLSTQIALY